MLQVKILLTFHPLSSDRLVMKYIHITLDYVFNLSIYLVISFLLIKTKHNFNKNADYNKNRQAVYAIYLLDLMKNLFSAPKSNNRLSQKLKY